MELTGTSRPRASRDETDVTAFGEQARLAWHQAAWDLGVGVVAAPVIAGVLSLTHSAEFVWLWLGAVVLVSVLRLGLLSALRRASAGAGASPARWGRYYILSASLSGLVWGALGWNLYTVDSPTVVSVLIFVLAAVTAVGLASMAVVPLAYSVFLLFTLLPAAVMLFHLGGPYATAAVLLALFGVILLFTASALNRTVRQSIQLGVASQGRIDTFGGPQCQRRQGNTDLDGQPPGHARTRGNLPEDGGGVRDLAEAASWAVAVVRDHVLYVNPAARQLLAATAGEGGDGAWLELIPADVRGMSSELLRSSAPVGRRVGPMQVPLSTRHNTRRWGEISLCGIVFDGRPAVMMTLLDVTERRAAVEAIFAKERLQVTLGSIGDGVIATDPGGCVEYMNEMAERMTGWAAREGNGLPLATVLCLTGEESDTGVQDPLAAARAAGKAVRLANHTALVQRGSGKEVPVEVTAAPIGDRRGANSGAVVVLHDVSDMRSLARQLAYQASHDPLTGLINRREFETRLQQALDGSAGQGQCHVLCYLDLDKFKTVNDRAGHVAGDALLVRLAEVIGRRLADDHALGRLGGDEFGVLLPNSELPQAHAVAERLRDAVRHFRFFWDGQVFAVGVSIGIVPIADGHHSLTDLLRAADSACYAAKARGGNHIHVFQRTDADPVRRPGHMHWGARIQKALDQRRFRLVAQPIVSLRPEEVNVGFHELLVRMVGGNGALVEPGQFLPAAERYHLTPAIDRWVVDYAFGLISRGELSGVCMINLSEQSLQARDFHEWLISRLVHDIPEPQRVCFEIKETALMHDLDWARGFMESLKGEGCRFALDDFGTGLSAFGHLKHLPVDYLKIDSSFVRNMVRDGADHAMVRSIHRMAEDLGIRTIAEGVEDGETERVLRALGVDYLQGRWLGSPAPMGVGHPLAAESRDLVICP